MKSAILAAAAAIALTGSASAATITWGNANNITGDAGTGIAVKSIDPYPGREAFKSTTTTGTADIYSVGTSVLAVNFTGQTFVDYPINVTFFESTPQQTTFISANNTPGLTQNGVTLSMPGWSVNMRIGTNSPQGNSYGGVPFSSYDTLSYHRYDGDGGDATLSLSGLTEGQKYAMQYWVQDLRADAEGRTLTLDGQTTLDFDTITNGDGVGQWAIGTFTADGSSQTINITSNAFAEINLFQLRAIPEPTTAAMAGLAGLGLLLRRRRA